ncbi:plasma membrane H+-ATPase [Ascosphaera pollenicola]|nr:plasma membrane H+-ATPase [Ascosphaera pollenicola]
MFKNASKPLLKDSISLLTSRNGKPYGAAATVEHLTATQFLQGLNYDVLNPFIADQLPELVLSPSGSRLISVLFLCRDSESFNPALSKILDILKDSDVQIVPSSLLQALFSSVSADDFSSYPILQDYSKKICTSLIFDVRKDWSDIAGVLENPASPDDLKISMAEDIIFHLYTRRVLEGIFALVNKSENILRLFAHGPTGAKLIFRLLYLSENDDEDAEDIITSLLQKTEHVRGEEDQAKTAIEILQRNFASANKTLLSVDAMIDVAEDAISASSDPSKTLIQLLPSAAQWSDALEPFLNLPPFLAETQWNSLGGLAAVVPREGPIGRDYRVVQVFDDEKGLTAAWRLASYVTRIFNGRSLDSPDEETRSTLFTYVPLVAQIINCDVSIPESRKTRNAFWGEHVIDEAVEIVSQSRALMKSWTDGSDALFDHWEGLIGNLSGDSPKAYNFAETYVNVVSGKESWKAQDVEKRLQWARKLKTQEDPFVLAAILAAYQDAVASHPLGVRLCNELVADLTSMSSESKEAIPKLVQLRSLGRQPLERVQNQRLVILVNRLISRLEDSLDQTALATEITLVLYEVLPLIKEMYGSQWSAW